MGFNSAFKGLKPKMPH